jgi:hypothetical protein
LVPESGLSTSSHANIVVHAAHFFICTMRMQAARLLVFAMHAMRTRCACIENFAIIAVTCDSRRVNGHEKKLRKHVDTSLSRDYVSPSRRHCGRE